MRASMPLQDRTVRPPEGLLNPFPLILDYGERAIIIKLHKTGLTSDTTWSYCYATINWSRDQAYVEDTPEQVTIRTCFFSEGTPSTSETTQTRSWILADPTATGSSVM
ncbi:Hypp4364 [Branchiostoma lanceolatum]|uniref:Hypp4364 protein n=1 Tax=Branchiostoma lanceolatum TaxID=7740 RepID=A0A8K0EVP7_BRALA|nr:Hypp4364 [Branchiostoma lanceolatum]